MQRIECPERDDWQATAEAAGFDFHTLDGERYWDERAYYAFALDEIERQIESPTGELHKMCLALVRRVVDDERLLQRLKIPAACWPLIAESWQRRDAACTDASISASMAVPRQNCSNTTPTPRPRSSRPQCSSGPGLSRASNDS